MEEAEQLNWAEYELLRRAGEARSKLQSDHALRHLKDGFMHRLLILQEARLELAAIWEAQDDDGFEGNQTVRLSLFLGAFYLNLVGALDNLAWALNYEFQILDNVDEGDVNNRKGSKRNLIGLFNPGFLKKLEESNDGLSARLRDYKKWYEQVKSFRDPTAHRIPPGFAAGQIAEDDQPEFERLLEEAKQAFATAERLSTSSSEEVELDFDASMAEHRRFMDLIYRGYELRHQAESLGTFSPIIINFHPDGHEIAWAPTLISKDLIQFTEVSSLVLAALIHQNT